MRILLLIAIFGTVVQHCSAVCTPGAATCQFGVAAMDGTNLIARFHDDTTNATGAYNALTAISFVGLTSTDACNADVCGTNSSCAVVDATTFTCSCQTYFEATRSETDFVCTDIDECATSTDDCHTDADCTNESPLFSCACKTGYSGNGTYCEDILECTPNPCGDNADCAEPVPANHTCTCRTGYTGDPDPYTNCTDINECALGTHNCDSNAVCSNTIGSFNCACNSGFSGDGLTCADLNECTNSTLYSCPNNSSCVNLPAGAGSTCDCDAGFTGNATYCEDIKECSNSTLFSCPNNSTCVEEVGSYTCVCDPGFTGNATSCQDLDECTNSSLYSCPNNSTCVNLLAGAGSTCACDAGFTGNETYCEDIQECLSSPCHAAAVCDEPTIGNYTCTCDLGYSGDGYVFCERTRQAICIEFELTCDSLTFDADLINTASALFQNVTGLLEPAIQAFITIVDNLAILENVTFSFVNSSDGLGDSAATVQLCINNTNIAENDYLTRVDIITEATTCGAKASPDECALGIDACDTGRVCADSSYGVCCYNAITDYRSSIRFDHTFNVTLHTDPSSGEFSDICQTAIDMVRVQLDALETRGCTQDLNITCEQLQSGSVEAVLMINTINSTYDFTDIQNQLLGAVGSNTSFGTILGAGDFDECSDNYELDRNCSAFASCLNFAGSFSCECNNTYFDNGTTPGQICISPITVSCNGSTMSVSVLQGYFDAQDVNLTSLHLADESCNRTTHGVIVGDSIEFNVEINDCNTTLTTAADNTTIVASNYISNVPSSGFFTGLDITVPFECQLPGALNISAQFLGVIDQAILPNVAATGGFNLEFKLWDSTYTNAYDNTRSYSSNERIYGQCSVQNNIQGVSVKLDRCWGTPTSDSSDTSAVDFIENSCPKTNFVKNLNVISNGQGSARFSMQMFFFREVNSVYLHCALSVCTPSCASTCSGRRRRDVDAVEETKEVTITIQLRLSKDDPMFNNGSFGVFGINNQQPIIPESTTQDITLPIVCAILAFVLIVLLALVVVVAVRRRRSSKDAYDMTQVNMHAIGVKPPAY